jgi:hypothetical protein
LSVGSGIAVIGVERVVRDPDGVRAQLLREVWGLRECDLLWADKGSVAFRLTLDPWRALHAEGYPTETVGVLVLSGGSIYATPHDAGDRQWRHRYPWQASVLQELCLWDPTDDEALRWTWADGLVSFVTIVHRHLLAEEFARRHGGWPAEDAPHGVGPHAVRTTEMQLALLSWSR